MKKTFAFLMTTMILTASMTACSSEDSGSVTTTASGASSASDSGTTAASSGDSVSDGVITMGGSTSVEEIVSAMMQVYMGENEVDITYSGTGSSTGVAGVLEGTMDLGLASRSLKSSEEEQGAVSHVFAYDGIAVITNSGNSIRDISSEDLAKIFKKEITNWSELGGEDGQIVVIGRDAASGTRGAFEEILDVSDVTLYDSELEATGSVIASVAGNANAIGYVSLSAVDEQVVAVSVDGVIPSESTIKDETYPIQRPFIFVTNENISDAETEAFIEWATSDAVAELVSSKGGVAP